MLILNETAFKILWTRQALPNKLEAKLLWMNEQNLKSMEERTQNKNNINKIKHTVKGNCTEIEEYDKKIKEMTGLNKA